jgi:hypothetical protein
MTKEQAGQRPVSDSGGGQCAPGPQNLDTELRLGRQPDFSREPDLGRDARHRAPVGVLRGWYSL